MDVDINFDPSLNRQQVLDKFTNALRQLRTYAELTYHVSPFYFDNYVMVQYFQQQRTTNDLAAGGNASETPAAAASNSNTSNIETPFTWADIFKFELITHFLTRRRRILYWLFFILFAYCCVFACRHETSIVIVERGKESFATMRLWRRLTLPVLQRFPQLTELYDETCLMENPFFQMDHLSCEPCALVESVRDLSDSVAPHGRADATSKEFQRSTAPFTFKIKQSAVGLHDLYQLYASNQEIFHRDAYRVQSTNRHVTNIAELFAPLNASHVANDGDDAEATPPPWTFANSHNMWRFNRMLPARLMRRLFAPALPISGIALERYVAIDAPQAPSYTLPHTECANVYIQQVLGSRYIILRPTTECRHKCRTISIRLPQSVVLIYNWWYWRPISTPEPIADQMSISLLGSYC